MFTVELYARIRRAVMIEGLSRREAAQRFGVHRNTIAKMLLYAVPPGYRRRELRCRRSLKLIPCGLMAFLKATRAFTRSSAIRHTGFLSAWPMSGGILVAIQLCGSMWHW